MGFLGGNGSDQDFSFPLTISNQKLRTKVYNKNIQYLECDKQYFMASINFLILC